MNTNTGNNGILSAGHRARTFTALPRAMVFASRRRLRAVTPRSLRAVTRRTLPAALILSMLTMLLLPASALFGQEWSVKPENYLRGWDPVTVDIGVDKGPRGGGPCDDPGDYFQIVPFMPGEYRWLDQRRIIFNPAEAWPPLKEYEIISLGRRWTLTTMLTPPKKITPSPSRGNEPLSEFTVSYPYPMDPEILSDMVSVEVRPLPGVGDAGLSVLTSEDLSVKPLNELSSGGDFTYMIRLREPIGYGRHITLVFRLSPDERIPGSVASYVYTTAETFLLTSVGTGNTLLPVTATGATYAVSQAINIGTSERPVVLRFSERLSSLSLEEVKRMVRFEPAVREIRFETSGEYLSVYFKADRSTPYKVRILPEPIKSARGRVLGNTGEASFYFYLTQLAPYISWKAGQAIVERFGPQNFPMEGRGTERIDLRIYRIDPLDLNYWPFPSSPVTVNEQRMPPMPGEEDQAGSLERRIRLLGSPDFSDVITLPITERSSQSRFGLDLSPYLQKVSGGPNEPGTYLIGYRPLDGTENRYYVRLQVTDLSLSTVEEEHGIMFLVTSLSSGSPVSGAKITIEGTVSGKEGFVTLVSGVTDSRGRFYYAHLKKVEGSVRRIRIDNGPDRLVLDTSSPPPNFMNNHWYGSSSPWLSWISRDPVIRREEPVQKGYIFSDRPIYRPDEPVYISGFVRKRQQGDITADTEGKTRTVSITGPGYRNWTFEAELGSQGEFHVKFEEADLPTGEYQVRLFNRDGRETLDQFSFRKEAYRVPTFETAVSGPDRVRLDEPFKLLLTADYYAGGRVVGQEVFWSVTRYPYVVYPAGYGDFLFSSDERFTGRSPREQIGYNTYSDITDANGSSTITLDPSRENDGNPVRYIVEATVQGADRMTVTTTCQVKAMPPFLVGVRHPRFVRGELTASPEVLILGYDEKPLAGQSYTLRVYNRQWHSYLAESDFSTGDARYVSDVVDVKIYEQEFTSTSGPDAHTVKLPESGVYVVEVLARDNLGRLQSVKTDFFVEGDTPVSWGRTESNVFEAVPDKRAYRPGETVHLVIKSPYQEGNALCVIEGPKKSTYYWIPVKNGQAVFEFESTGDMTPQVPVHILLMRGRVAGTERIRGNRPDTGKPAAVASTTWIRVLPTDNQADLRLSHPEKTLPGKTLHMELFMTDPDGKPLDGVAILWLVDRAVLSLGEERFLDPLDLFIESLPSSLRFRETRNMIVGNLPVEENPGGGGGWDEAMEMGLLDRATVRKNFQTVPYYNPHIVVKDGRAAIDIPMPDNLTEFAVRAVGLAGFSRFATAKSKVAVRLPVIVQSAMPRFVRPGDAFEAGAVGRVVEGPGGQGNVAVRTTGMLVNGAQEYAERVTLEPAVALPVSYPFTVPVKLEGGDTVTVRIGIERLLDGAMDAFEIPLPVRHSVHRVTETTSVSIKKGDAPAAIAAPAEPFQPGSVRVDITAAVDPALLAIVSGLSFLETYPHGCTEQRVSMMYPGVALQAFLAKMGIEGTAGTGTAGAPGAGPGTGPSAQAFAELVQYLKETSTEQGLFAFWPGSTGYVSLTSYVLEFLVRAREQGFSVPADLVLSTQSALKKALRSDYRGFISGFSFRERVDALYALAVSGSFDLNYAYDLLAGAEGADLYSQARLLELFSLQGRGNEAAVKRLLEYLKGRVVFDLQNRQKVFAGLKYDTDSWGGLIISSETRTLAHVIKALNRYKYDDIRYLVDDLLKRGGPNGWGSTISTVAALNALAEVLPDLTGKPINIAISFADGKDTLELSGTPLAQKRFTNTPPGSLTVTKGSDPVYLLTRVSYLPSGTGADLASVSQGYSVQTVFHLYRDGAEVDRLTPKAGQTLSFSSGDIVEIEGILRISEPTTFIALCVPFAAGFEPLNPGLATAPREAAPAGTDSRQADYRIYGDDAMTWYFNELGKGEYHFFFRVRASFPGTFTQPPCTAENLYDVRYFGRGEGTKILILEKE